MYLDTTLLQAAPDEGLTWSTLFSDLPTDPAALFTLGLVVACIVLIAWAGRGQSGGDDGVPPAGT